MYFQLAALQTMTSTTAAPSTFVSAVRCYSAHAGLSKDEIQGRILDLLKNFDKVRSLPILNTSVIAFADCIQPGLRLFQGTFGPSHHAQSNQSNMSLINRYSFPATHTSPTTSVLTLWTPSRSSWPLKRSVVFNARGQRYQLLISIAGVQH